jgi:hypothetical protein
VPSGRVTVRTVDAVMRGSSVDVLLVSGSVRPATCPAVGCGYPLTAEQPAR